MAPELQASLAPAGSLGSVAFLVIRESADIQVLVVSLVTVAPVSLVSVASLATAADQDTLVHPVSLVSVASLVTQV